MFTGIRQAILPLALRRLHRKDDLQRACLLIETLARHWRDRQPLQLLIVAPAHDEHFIRASLPTLAGDLPPNARAAAHDGRPWSRCPGLDA